MACFKTRVSTSIAFSRNTRRTSIPGSIHRLKPKFAVHHCGSLVEVGTTTSASKRSSFASSAASKKNLDLCVYLNKDKAKEGNSKSHSRQETPSAGTNLHDTDLRVCSPQTKYGRSWTGHLSNGVRMITMAGIRHYTMLPGMVIWRFVAFSLRSVHSFTCKELNPVRMIHNGTLFRVRHT